MMTRDDFRGIVLGICFIIMISFLQNSNWVAEHCFLPEIPEAAAAASFDNNCISLYSCFQHSEKHAHTAWWRRILIHAPMHLFYNSKGCDQDVSVSFPEYKRDAVPLKKHRSLSVTVGGATHALLTFPGLRLFSGFWERYSRVGVLISV